MGVATQQPRQCGVQIEGQLCMVRTAGAGQCAYYHQATGGQQRQTLTDQMTQSALDQVAFNGSAHRLAHDETRTRRGSAPPRHMRVRGVAAEMDDEKRSAGSASAANRRCEVLPAPQPILGGKHGMGPVTIRRTAGRGPCCGGSRGWRGRRGCAYADGSRGSSHDGGCSAGRCACSLGGSRENRGSDGESPGCHRAPTKSSRTFQVHRFNDPPITYPEDLRPSVGRRQQPSTTRPRYGTCG